MPMPKELKDKWEEAQKTREPVDIGDIVVCDICCEDYTNSDESGGFIFGSKGVCPKCAERFMKNIRNCGEEQYVKAYCPEGMSFADFIRQYRGDNATIQIRKMKD